MSGGHFIFFPRWSEEQKWFLYSYILPSTTSTTVNWAEVKQYSTITKSYIFPACSNISKLIFNNDQALLLLVQNYDYLQTDLNSKYICVVDEELQLHQYVPMPHPNNMATIDLLTSPETQNCANFTRHVLACTWELCYQELLLWEHRCWNIQLYNTKHIYIYWPV